MLITFLHIEIVLNLNSVNKFIIMNLDSKTKKMNSKKFKFITLGFEFEIVEL